MNDREITILLKKADELRSLFVLGQRVIPFLEEIFVFVSEIQPLLDEINVSIEENLKKMPNASKQLSKVTEATELATTEIMDIVDGVVSKTDKMGNNLTDLQSIHDKNIQKAVKLLEIVKNGLQNKSASDEAIPELDKAINDLNKSSKEKEQKIISDTNDIIQSISMDSSSIMMSLQVQDITSQQIAAVNNLLETVQKKLANIMKRFQNADFSELVPESDDEKTSNVSKMHRDIAFDPDAVESISLKHERQGTVDQYMQEHNEGSNEDDDDGPTTQDDIDALFENSAKIEDKSEQKSEESEVSETTAKSDDEELSPDDIDKMFGSSDKPKEDEDNSDNDEESNDEEIEDNTEFSQDDIDKMFNS